MVFGGCGCWNLLRTRYFVVLPLGVGAALVLPWMHGKTVVNVLVCKFDLPKCVFSCADDLAPNHVQTERHYPHNLID